MKKMVRNELYLTVPSLFRCPISLDVMRSPVSLCTGVTYDRSSIQHWLESGHETCPATMQILSTKEFTPNLTLHRLIAHWSHQLSVPEQDVRVLIEKIGAEEENCVVVIDCLEKILEFVSSCEENRKCVSSFVDTIVGVLKRKGVEVVVLEMVVSVLGSILIENGVREKLNDLIVKNSDYLSSFLVILQKGSLDSKIESIRILDSISLDAESKRIVAETENLLPILFNHLKSAEDQTLTDAVLSILITVSISRSVKTQLIRLGFVTLLLKTVSGSFSSNQSIEKAIKLLSIIATSREVRLAVSQDTKCVARILEKIMKMNKTAREDAVVVLWSMCCVYKDERVKEAVIRNNGVTKILLVMQSEIDGIVRKMCGDLIKVLGKNGGLGTYDTKTTHIMPY